MRKIKGAERPLLFLQKIEYQESEFGKAYYDKLKALLYGDVCKIKGHSNRIQVRAEMQYVDKYGDFEVWACLSPVMVKEVKLHITPLLDSELNEKDLVVAFDIRMLNVELCVLINGNTSSASRDIKVIREVAQ